MAQIKLSDKFLVFDIKTGGFKTAENDKDPQARAYAEPIAKDEPRSIKATVFSERTMKALGMEKYMNDEKRCILIPMTSESIDRISGESAQEVADFLNLKRANQINDIDPELPYPETYDKEKAAEGDFIIMGVGGFVGDYTRHGNSVGLNDYTNFDLRNATLYNKENMWEAGLDVQWSDRVYEKDIIIPISETQKQALLRSPIFQNNKTFFEAPQAEEGPDGIQWKRDQKIQNGRQDPFFQSFYEKEQGRPKDEMPSLGDALAEIETNQQKLEL